MFWLKKVFQLRDKANPDNEKPFLEHLEDLRVMITRSLIVLTIAVTACLGLQERLMKILTKPVEEVQAIHNAKLLPDTITVPNWDQAKLIERAALGLGPERGKALLQEFDQATRDRVELVQVLRALAVLPKEKRDAYVHRTVAEPQAQLLAVMLEKGATPEIDIRGNVSMLSTLGPTEAFMLSMKLAFFAGIVVAFPFLMYFILQFILPGLHQHEQKVLWPALAIGFGLFLFGVFFAYFFVLPRALTFFYEWGVDTGVSNDWRIGTYITFATQFTLLFGASFELPVVVMVLVKIGLLSYETMRKTRSYAIVAIFVVAAVITPTPDAFTLIVMAGPMCILYEICIWLAYFDDKKKAKREEEEERERKEEDRLRLERILKDEEEREAGSTSRLEDAAAKVAALPLHEPEGKEAEDKSDHVHEPWDPSALEEGWKAGKDTSGEELPSVVTDHLPGEEPKPELDDTPPESIPGEEKRRMSDLGGGDEPEKK